MCVCSCSYTSTVEYGKDDGQDDTEDEDDGQADQEAPHPGGIP